MLAWYRFSDEGPPAIWKLRRMDTRVCQTLSHAEMMFYLTVPRTLGDHGWRKVRGRVIVRD